MNAPIAAWLVAMSVLAGTGSAAPDLAKQRLEEAVGQVTSVAARAKCAEQLARDVRPLLENALSFEKMTQRAIGPGWREFSPAQRDEAVRLFTTLIIRNYCDKYTLGENPKVQYRVPREVQPGRVEIPTRVLYRGSRYDVLYRMEDPGIWKITDIVVEGVSFVANYRAQFDAQFKRGGTTAVLAALRASVGNSQ
jgi:phospholipid transport system substrate-binding protein